MSVGIVAILNDHDPFSARSLRRLNAKLAMIAQDLKYIAYVMLIAYRSYQFRGIDHMLNRNMLGHKLVVDERV